MNKYPALGSAQVIRAFKHGNGEPWPTTAIIELDKKHSIAKKEHQIYVQQGKQYGSVGDRCDSLTHEELFKYAEEGSILLRTANYKLILFESRGYPTPVK